MLHGKHQHPSPCARSRPYVQESWCFQGQPWAREEREAEDKPPSSLPSWVGQPQGVLLCLRESPVGLCLSYLPRNLLMNTLVLTPFFSLSHLPTPLQGAPRPPPKSVPCPPTRVSGAILSDPPVVRSRHSNPVGHTPRAK